MRMNRYLVFLTAALFISSLVSPVMAFDWVKLTSVPGKFSVLMPGPDIPKETTETTTEAKTAPSAAPYTTHMFIQRSESGVIFLVGWVDYAPAYKPNAQAELAANRDNFVKGTDAKLGSESAITLGQYAGIEFTATRDSDGAAIKSRVYMIGAKPYMLATVAPKGQDNTRDIEKFFASFQMK
jgi:hypothetical protein